MVKLVSAAPVYVTRGEVVRSNPDLENDCFFENIATKSYIQIYFQQVLTDIP